MKTIAIINVKGGVGKTVSAVNIGACLSERGSRVLIVDLDSQANATQMLKSYSVDADSITNVFLDKSAVIADIIVPTQYDRLSILPSNIQFAFVESKVLSDTTRQQQTRLKKALAQVSAEYDYCLIDCAPSLGVVSINALVAADSVVVPIKIDQFALDGLDYLIQTVFEIRDEFNEKLQFIGSFVTMDNVTTVNKEIKKVLQQAKHLRLLDTTIKNTVKVTESTFNQVPVVFGDMTCAASVGYRELTDELLKNGL